MSAQCAPICGDGLRLGAEVCDDGNAAAGDGCSATCDAVEAGFACSGGSASSKDACASTPRVVVSLQFAGVPSGMLLSDAAKKTAMASAVAALLGTAASNVVVTDVYNCPSDGRCTSRRVLRESEGRDLAASTYVVVVFTIYAPTAAGASTVLTALASLSPAALRTSIGTAVGAGSGFTATVGPYAASMPGCGNGVRAASEACDDANTLSNDGCSSVCAIEAGYTCAASTTVDACTKEGGLAAVAASLAWIAGPVAGFIMLVVAFLWCRCRKSATVILKGTV